MSSYAPQKWPIASTQDFSLKDRFRPFTHKQDLEVDQEVVTDIGGHPFVVRRVTRIIVGANVISGRLVLADGGVICTRCQHQAGIPVKGPRAAFWPIEAAMREGWFDK